VGGRDWGVLLVLSVQEAIQYSTVQYSTVQYSTVQYTAVGRYSCGLVAARVQAEKGERDYCQIQG